MFLHAVALLILCPAGLMTAAETCGFSSKSQWKKSIVYEYSCTEEGLLTDQYDLALCIARRNTLNAIFECAGLNPNRLLHWHVAQGRILDGLDLIPTDTFSTYKDVSIDDYDNGENGELYVTPRGLLWQISLLPQCQQCHMTQPIAHCPQENWQDFLDCLCCECVSTSHLKCLDNCIFHPDYRRFAHLDAYDQTGSVCDRDATCGYESYMDQDMPLCNNIDQDERSIQAKDVAADAESDGRESASSSCTSLVYIVSNGNRRTQCVDDSDSHVYTRVEATAPWSKASAAPTPAPASTSDTRGAQVATGTTSDSNDGAAQTAVAGSSASASNSGANMISTSPKLVVLGLAGGLLALVV